MDFQRPVESVIPGVQGRILGVLAERDEPLNLRSLAHHARVSSAQASRVLPHLVALGVVARRDVPPSALFSLVDDHVAGRLLRELSWCWHVVFDDIGELAAAIRPEPVSVIVFGSLARGDGEVGHDVDVVVVRPDDTAEEDPAWTASVVSWCEAVRRLTGDDVDLRDVAETEVTSRLARPRGLWAAVAREGVAVRGSSVDELRGPPHADP